MKIEYLSSQQNPKIKLIQELYHSKGRKKHGLFVAEGIKEISMAYLSDYKLHYLFINDHFLQKKDFRSFPFKDELFYQINTKLFSKISYREDTEGIIAIFESRYRIFEDLTLSKLPFFIVLESVEKPGNLGAVIRTADAVKADAVVVCNSATDLFNPNVIRSSLGCIFTVPVVLTSNEEAIHWFCKHNINIYAAALQEAVYYYEVDFRQPTAIVFGTEAHGLSSFWRQQAHKIIKIPMLGKIDSLNVSNSVAVLSYEVVRQRMKILTS